MSQTASNNGQWTLLDEDGQTALSFTSFLNIDLKAEGKALSYPVEQGGFANYNKLESSLDLQVTLGFQGNEADFEQALERLEEYKKGAVKLAVVTPASLYQSMTLESYSYKRGQDAGAGMLAVELALKEVREVQTRVSTTVITKPKNPSSADKQNTGKTQSKDVLSSILG